jgi:hypothetical protein
MSLSRPLRRAVRALVPLLVSGVAAAGEPPTVLLIPDSFRENIWAFSPVDGALISNDYVPDNGLMSQAICAIGSPSGTILVSDELLDRVIEITPTGQLIRIVIGPKDGLDGPFGIEVRDGAVYVCSRVLRGARLRRGESCDRRGAARRKRRPRGDRRVDRGHAGFRRHHRHDLVSGRRRAAEDGLDRVDPEGEAADGGGVSPAGGAGSGARARSVIAAVSALFPDAGADRTRSRHDGRNLRARCLEGADSRPIFRACLSFLRFA